MNSKRYLFILLVMVALILSGCGDNQDDNKTENSSGNNSTGEASSIPTSRPQPTRTAVDPGPYFSPGKPFPNEDPTSFTGPEQVGNFQRSSVSGQANTAAGVTGIYTNADNATIILNIYYAADKPSAMAFVEQMGTSARLTRPPEFLLLDENTSYTLYGLGDGRVIYAWTREQWIFVATSPQGRPSLDAFMREFPY